MAGPTYSTNLLINRMVELRQAQAIAYPADTRVKPAYDGGWAASVSVMPAKAGIQYAGRFPCRADVSGILDHPLSRVMTA
jgi:hypothetical protein